MTGGIGIGILPRDYATDGLFSLANGEFTTQNIENLYLLITNRGELNPVKHYERNLSERF